MNIIPRVAYRQPSVTLAKTAKVKEEFNVMIADSRHLHLAAMICDEMEASAKARGTGISKRTPEYLQKKMLDGEAVIAFAANGEWAGFSYIASWSNGEFVSNSGLIVSPDHRKGGVAKQIKRKIVQLSHKKYPAAKIFGLTTGLAVMKINSELGFEPVTYSEITKDPEFWKGCKSCVNFHILESKGYKQCLCTAMMLDPNIPKTTH
jgi:hypothetical protein